MAEKHYQRRSLSKRRSLLNLTTKFFPAAHAHLFVNMGHMLFHRSFGNEEFLSDLPVGASPVKESGHLKLPLGKPAPFTGTQKISVNPLVTSVFDCSYSFLLTLSGCPASLLFMLSMLSTLAPNLIIYPHIEHKNNSQRNSKGQRSKARKRPIPPAAESPA